VSRAIDRGVAYLKRVVEAKGDEVMYLPTAAQGSQATAADNLVYRKSLIGWTLLECGTAPTDHAVEKIAAFVRENYLGGEQETRDLAAAILFLDRLGDSRDRPIIETCALRLVAGQKLQGLWGRYCNVEGTFSATDQQKLADYLKTNADVRPDSDPAGEPEGADQLPPYLRDSGLVRWQRGFTVPPLQYIAPPSSLAYAPDPATVLKTTDVGDATSTQLALAALWTARRDGVPVNPCLAFVDRCYRRLQHEDGGWSWLAYADPGRPRQLYPQLYTPDPCSTGAGLLALAVGSGVSGEQAPGGDAVIKSGFAALSPMVETDIGLDDLNAPPGVGSTPYFGWWALNNVAVAYGRKELGGGKDWSAWLTTRLVEAQDASGSWNANNAGFECTWETCYALLALKRVNVFSDLTTKLRKTLSVGN
jgi:hypothetical protein